MLCPGTVNEQCAVQSETVLLHARSSRLNKAPEDSLTTIGLRHQITRPYKGRTSVAALLNQAPRRHICTLI
jgi:hypothetical protein